METLLELDQTIEKLKNNEKFGLYDQGAKCYFEDGTRVSYQTLWKAIRVVNNIGEHQHCRPLAEECPANYLGTFKQKFYRQPANATLRIFNRFLQSVMGDR